MLREETVSRPHPTTVRLPDPSREKGVSLALAAGAWGDHRSPNDGPTPPPWAPAASTFPRHAAARAPIAGGGKRWIVGRRDRVVGVAARHATPRRPSGGEARRDTESEGARAGGRSLCVRSPPPDRRVGPVPGVPDACARMGRDDGIAM